MTAAATGAPAVPRSGQSFKDCTVCPAMVVVPAGSFLMGSLDGDPQTAPVGSFPPNRFGLCDVMGNVWEWVEDCWNRNYQGAPMDGSAWIEGKCERRVLRGGSWVDLPGFVRLPDRIRTEADARINNFGFRVALSLP